MAFLDTMGLGRFKGFNIAVNVVASVFNALIAIAVGTLVDYAIKSYVTEEASQFLFSYGTPIAAIIGAFVFFVLMFGVVVRHGRELAMKVFIWISNVSRPARIGYSLKSKTIIYRYETPNKLSMEKRYRPIVEEGSFNGVADNFWWTGSHGDLEPTCPVSGQKYVGEISRFGPARYKIEFTGRREYHKGDTVPEMIVRFDDIDDSDHAAQLHLSTGVYEKTDLLILRVEFPRELIVNSIRLLTYIHYTDPFYYSAEDATLQCCNSCVSCNANSRNHCYVEWRISHPIYGGKYMIEWVLPDREALVAP